MGERGETCLTCDRFPLGYTGSKWNCRASGRKADKANDACSLHIPRRPDEHFSITDDDVRLGLDGVMTGLPKMSAPTFADPAPLPPGLRSATGGVVYFVRCQHLTKVGTTGLPIHNRLKGMSTDNPFDLRLWALLEGAEQREREVHLHLSAYRWRGEWFHLDMGVRDRVRSWILSNGGEVYDDAS